MTPRRPPAALGLRAHSGWAALVAVGGGPASPQVLDRRRIEMADGRHKAITEIRAGDLVLTKDGPYRARAVRPSGVRRVGPACAKPSP